MRSANMSTLDWMEKRERYWHGGDVLHAAAAAATRTARMMMREEGEGEGRGGDDGGGGGRGSDVCK